VPIAQMGDYHEVLRRRAEPRDPYMDDDERARAERPSFGNPFRRWDANDGPQVSAPQCVSTIESFSFEPSVLPLSRPFCRTLSACLTYLVTQLPIAVSSCRHMPQLRRCAVPCTPHLCGLYAPTAWPVFTLSDPSAE
jgi:hypothetical protein